MAAHDTQASGNYVSGTTFSWSHTNASGAKNLIWVGYKFNALESITGVTVGGSAATFVSGVQNGGGANRLELWKHESPSSGAVTVEVTFNGNLGGDGGKASGVSISSTSLSGFGTGITAGPTSDTTPTITITSLGSSDIPYAGVYLSSDPTEADTICSEIQSDNFLNVARQSTGGDGVINWTQGAPDEWLCVGARAIDAGGGGGGSFKRFALLGVG